MRQLQHRAPVRALVGLVLGAGLFLAAPAVATEDDEIDDPDATFTGKQLPKLELPEAEVEVEARSAHVEYKVPDGLTREEYLAREHGNKIYRGAEALKLDPDFVNGVHQGLELLYLRKYTECRDHFRALEQKYPGTAVAAVADTLVWQALMLENFDLRFDKQYQVSSKEAKSGLEAALAQPGGDAWEHVLLGGIVGIEAIHAMRKTQLLGALQLALSAMDHIGKARQAAPEFTDLALADGMYNYWRSVVTMSSNVLPDFDDRRAEGIEQMQTVESAGVFLAPLATMALAFTWIEENDYKRAINACIRNKKAYPDNIVNNLITGTTWVSMKRYDNALGAFDEVLRVDPANKRVRYWRGVTHLKAGNLAEAETEFKKYLESDYMEDYQKANAHYRLGQVYFRQKRYADSFAAYKLAEKTNGHKGAKKAMDRMKERQKEGKITF